MGRILTRKGLVKKADAIVSLYVRKRDKKCVTCGSYQNPQCGHLFSRIWYNTRWDLYNCNQQCASCNGMHEADPVPYQNWYKSRYGIDAFEELHNRARQIRKWTDQELLDMIEDIKQSIKDLQ